MSSSNKRCSSGILPSTQAQPIESLKHISILSRSKTYGYTGSASLKAKPERLQPLATNKTSQLKNKLDDIDSLHPAMVNELCLHARGLSTIPDLSQFRKLQMLDLSCNNLTRIENLKNLSNLHELKLYGNKIERIENLECLNHLQILQLQYNEIQSIEFGLAYLTRLQSLRIDSNKLSAVRSEEMSKLSQLKLLDVSDCRIEDLDFINILSSITELRACDCCLKALPNQFRNLRYLNELNLSNNELINITPLKNLSSLRILHLANNNIQDIQIIALLIHLYELDLNNNQITSLPNSFDKLVDLQYLSVANNRINSWNDIDVIRRMSSLFILHIIGNPFLSEIENFTEKLFEFCPSLEIIDDVILHDNDVETIQRKSDQELMNIDKELKEIDEALEQSIADAQAQFDVILNNLQKLDIINDETKQDTKSTADNSTEPKSSNQKSKHRLFQALTFSEENYQNSHQDETNV